MSIDTKRGVSHLCCINVASWRLGSKVKYMAYVLSRMRVIVGMHNSQMASTRLLFAGCGAIARHHLRALQASGRSWQVSAVADPNRTAADNFVKELPHQCEVCYIWCILHVLVGGAQQCEHYLAG